MKQYGISGLHQGIVHELILRDDRGTPVHDIKGKRDYILRRVYSEWPFDKVREVHDS